MSGGRKGVSSSTSTRGLRSTGDWGLATGDWTTTPVRVRVPRGTRTRAPTGGSGRPSGRLYVRAPRPGTGTAISTRRMGLVAGALENGPRLLQVFPRLAFAARRPQQVRGVERRDQLGAAEVEHAAAQPRDRLLRPQQRLRRE